MSTATTRVFLALFLLWLGIGTWLAWPGEPDPSRAFAVRAYLMRRENHELTVRGDMLQDSYFALRDKAWFVGPGAFDFRRKEAQPMFLLLTSMLELPPGETLTIKSRDTKDDLELVEAEGMWTHIAVPLTQDDAKFTFVPSNRRVAYRFPRHLGVQLMVGGQRPLQLTAVPEFSMPIDLPGGHVKLGGGWNFDPGEDKLRVPKGVIHARQRAWLRFEPPPTGPTIRSRIRIPFRKLGESQPDPTFAIDGVVVPATIENGIAELPLKIDKPVVLRITCGVTPAPVLTEMLAVDVSGITFVR